MAGRQSAGVHHAHHRAGNRAQRLRPDGFLFSQETLHRGRDLPEQPRGRRPGPDVLSALLGRQRVQRLQLALWSRPVQNGQHGH